MRESRTELIAREAAKLFVTGRASELDSAITAAIDTLGLHDVPRPGRGVVRGHIRGLAMQVKGEAAYRDEVRDMLTTVEQIMTLLDERIDDARLLLVGRAARQEIDGGVTPHMRIYTECPIEGLAAVLVEQEYDEPSIETVNTRFGRLNRLRLTEGVWDVVITRCLPDMYSDRANDLFEGKRITVADLKQARAMISER